ncbi:ribosomal RNA small subunit methyltransferase A [Clostridia bacterium]|nr:ribosomal RNA small subunit methyltransferase A [Clostridia bacterium]
MKSNSIHSQTLEIIKDYDFKIKKKYGQNFLTDDFVLSKIVNAAELTEDDLVIEVGPGLGTLTRELAKHAGAVCAVEIDKDAAEILNAVLPDIRVINADILKIDIMALAKEYKKNVKIVANLPYYVATAIVTKLLEDKMPISSIIVMVQKEVGERFAAAPNSKDYGALSVFMKYHAETYIAANAPRNCFLPRPNVDSAVVKITPKTDFPLDAETEKFMFEFVKAAFATRRKTLVNCIAAKGLAEKDTLLGALSACELSAQIRGEAMSLDDFIKVCTQCMPK